MDEVKIEEGVKSKDYPDTLNHARTALENVQETIRFIDTKVAGGMAFAAVVLGLTISRSVLAKQLAMQGVHCLCLLILLWLLLAIAVGFLVESVYFAKQTLWPRQTSLDVLKGKTWILFPLSSRKDGEDALYKAIKERLEAGMSEASIVSEFVDQLTINGHILSQKFVSCRKMFRAIWCYSLTMLVLGALSLILYAFDESGMATVLEQCRAYS